MIYDVVIIGGGIVGAGVFRDLALHGVNVLLLEKGDFSSQTSQGSSKMLHGGIRYLETFDFALVQEALEEKNLWLKLAPHLTIEKEFHLPVYAGTKWPLPFVRLGLFLYDMLSHFQNKPSGQASAELTLERYPQLNSQGLKGSGTYFDGIVDDHKLSNECLWDGEIEPNALAQNYQEVLSIEYGKTNLITVQDTLNGEIRTIETRYTVVATGPFTDELMRGWGIPWDPVLLPSKGIHLWIKSDALKLYGPMVLPAKDGRVVFVIPQRHAILVGTTETEVKEEMFNIQATDEDVNYLIGVLGDYFPGAKVTKDHILSTFAAVRPLVREAGSTTRGKTSRNHRIFRPTPTIYALLGGKYTTFRRMAQDLCKEIVPRLGIPYNSNHTLSPLRKPSLVGTFENNEVSAEEIEEIIESEKVRTMEDLVHRRLSWLKNWDQYSEIAGKPLNYWKDRLKR